MNQIAAEWFDGRSSEAHQVLVVIDQEHLVISGENIDRRYLLDQLQWPERGGAGARQFSLPDGTTLQAHQVHDWQALAQRAGVRPSRIQRWQNSYWRLAIVAMVFVGALASAYIWGIPALSRVVVTLIPHSVDSALGAQALASIDEDMLRPSQLSDASRREIRRGLDDALSTNALYDSLPFELIFRASKAGPNAFALPGGTIVMTDELVELANGDTPMIIGVLAHEIGHVKGRHGMQQIGSTFIAGALVSLILGDYNGLITSVPVVLGQLAYSRAHETEADLAAIQILTDANISPAVMVRFFRLIKGLRGNDNTANRGQASDQTRDLNSPSQDPSEHSGDADTLWSIFGSHPGTASRITMFEKAARQFNRR